MRRWFVVCALLGSACTLRGHVAERPGNASSAPDARARAEKLLDASDYPAAERAFRELASDQWAKLGLAEVLLSTGRAEGAADTARLAASGGAMEPDGLAERAVVLEARALRQRGRRAEALALVEPWSTVPGAFRAQWLQGELLLDLGQRQRAEPVLQHLVDGYNRGRLRPGRLDHMALLGRASMLLGSPHDANHALGIAMGPSGPIEAWIWRAEAFAAASDPEEAQRILMEAIVRAPNHPEVNAALARLRLERASDFDTALHLAKDALDVDPTLGAAYFVEAAVALMDDDFSGAHAKVSAGLRANPADLELLSLDAAAAWLEGDPHTFEARRAEVQRQNPEYAHFYELLSWFGAWGHRYEALTTLLQSALGNVRGTAALRENLGINLIDSGHESDGVLELAKAFDENRFSVRAHNLLRLHRDIIPRDYVSERRSGFGLRYPRRYERLLAQNVTELVERAQRDMTTRYGIKLEALTVEVYGSAEDLSVRTAGIPSIDHLGVCFGKTLAVRVPGETPFSLSNVLWHELSHSFHIQLSRSRVPRWFTEGLADYEAERQRKNPARGSELPVYELVAAGRLPGIVDMNQVFTHAERASDVSTAYQVSTLLIEHVIERYGFGKVVAMLREFGAGASVRSAVEHALHVPPSEVDASFRAALATRFERYQKQFVPHLPQALLPAARALVREKPKSLEARLAFAAALIHSERRNDGKWELDEALRLDPKNAQARFLEASLLVDDEPWHSGQILLELTRDGHDGFPTRSLLARSFARRKDWPSTERELNAALAFDPENEAALEALVETARRLGHRDGELRALKDIVRFEQVRPERWQRFIELLLADRRTNEALQIGAEAVEADPLGPETHEAYARALRAGGRSSDARHELELGLACQNTAEQRTRLEHALNELGPG